MKRNSILMDLMGFHSTYTISEKEPRWFSKRHTGGGSINIWFRCSAFELHKVVRISGNIDGPKYMKMLEKEIPDAVKSMGLDDWIFQQDGASSHRSKVAKNWFNQKDINVMK